MVLPVNPVLDDLRRTDVLSDPAVRELYFGSTDTPGLIAQATDAAQKAFLDQPAILQRTAGLTADEQLARNLARSGIGSYQPFLRRAEQSLTSGLGGLASSIGAPGLSARDYLGLSTMQYDPRMARSFYDPFEQQVVQRTIDDALQAAAQQDIQQRASDIARGGESAFGSRARLTAGERQRAFGRGLGDVLSRIRSGGFQTAQDRALQELRDIRSGARSAAQLESGFGGALSSAQRGFATDLIGLGQTGQRLRSQDIAQLGSLGGVQRGIEEQRLAREFAQQQAQRQAPLQATKFIQGFAPKYVSGQAQITKQYGMPDDPRQTALSAGLGTFASLAPQQQAAAPTQTVNVQGQGQGQGQFVGFQPQGQMVPSGQMMPFGQYNPYQQMPQQGGFQQVPQGGFQQVPPQGNYI